MKVVKFIFGYDFANHCKFGAEILHRQGCVLKLVELARQHHDYKTNNSALTLFMRLDDEN